MSQLRASIPTPSVPKKKCLVAYGVENYLPSRPSTEDDASILKHEETLCKESKRKNPDYSVIQTLMDLTFADRRLFVTKDLPSFSAVKEKYPCLFNAHQVGFYLYL